MPKNTQGGSRHKKQASKNFITSSNKLRIAQEEGEVYSQVTKMLGNGMCHVQDLTGKIYLCIIRGKFKGKGKSNNRLAVGSWVLIGLRDWATSQADKNKHDTCDLLEVYSDSDKERLKNTVDKNWSLFITNDCNNTFTENVDENFKFSNQDQEEYSNLMKKIEEETTGKSVNKVISLTTHNESEEDDEINIDDI